MCILTLLYAGGHEPSPVGLVPVGSNLHGGTLPVGMLLAVGHLAVEGNPVVGVDNHVLDMKGRSLMVVHSFVDLVEVHMVEVFQKCCPYLGGI